MRERFEEAADAITNTKRQTTQQNTKHKQNQQERLTWPKVIINNNNKTRTNLTRIVHFCDKMSHAVSGMAASIRAATESETFDLAGANVSTITNTIRSAFEEPLPLSEMIRITFVTGAGKLARQKYDDGAAKAVTSTLRELGFEEDRGASAVLECAGTFKQQHDTGKNLKTVVVFPNVVGSSSGDNAQLDGDMQNLSLDNKTGSSIFPDNSPENNIAHSSMAVFERMIASKCQTWTQKKGASLAIGTIKSKLEDLEQKLMAGTPLSDAEQSFYDSVSMSSLEEKQAYVKEQMHEQVDIGKITVAERNTLLKQVQERLDTLVKEIATAETEGKAKRVENLKNAKTKAEERKQKLEQINAKTLPPLKHEAEIAKLRKELEPLLEVEDASKGRLLSVKETQALARKEEILEQIEQLEIDSRGWFEEDESFEARVNASKAAWMARLKQQSKKKKPAAGTSTGSAWSTTTTTRKKASAAPKKPAAKSKGKAGGGSVFSMMMDSDSD